MNTGHLHDLIVPLALAVHRPSARAAFTRFYKLNFSHTAADKASGSISHRLILYAQA